MRLYEFNNQIFYHVTKHSNQESILANGIKAQNVNDVHIKRKPGIYLFDNLADAKEWAHWDYMTYKQPIDIYQVNPTGEVVQDPHPEMQEFGAYITYATVPPKNIKIVSNNITESYQLDEVKVLSSWIADLRYENNYVIMTLLNGRSYRLLGIPEGLFRNWVNAPSKGKFWHSDIRGNYRASRI